MPPFRWAVCGVGIAAGYSQSRLEDWIVGMCGKGPPAVCIFGRWWGRGLGRLPPPYVFLGGGRGLERPVAVVCNLGQASPPKIEG